MATGDRLSDEEIAELKVRLSTLKSEHRDLDEVIARVSEGGNFDQLMMKRLKKRKLMLKDQIAKLESQLLPDIIA
ncbi:MAG TPA: DUF465 domain-containing protein [Alphaproteobacteria bacterium]|nr:DUF465 domain-containing protein [Alphaproteobacteria bacterium]